YLAYASGKMRKEVRDQQFAAIIPNYEILSREQMNDIVKIDASLAAMQFMLVARAHGYETKQIGGVDAEKLAEKIGLDQER
ncbi:nitroreductase family protein, partial [Enterococcus faecalis]|uniref:nitroreductase family protein n=1 Tax=Enterococcus faecalis TaxID=1351 RepID=UPI00113F76B6